MVESFAKTNKLRLCETRLIDVTTGALTTFNPIYSILSIDSVHQSTFAAAAEIFCGSTPCDPQPSGRLLPDHRSRVSIVGPGSYGTSWDKRKFPRRLHAEGGIQRLPFNLTLNRAISTSICSCATPDLIGRTLERIWILTRCHAVQYWAASNHGGLEIFTPWWCMW